MCVCVCESVCMFSQIEMSLFFEKSFPLTVV